jgi:formylglycine-generating enzyme required for sulfatase activity
LKIPVRRLLSVRSLALAAAGPIVAFALASGARAGDGDAAPVSPEVAAQRKKLAAQFDRGHRYAVIVGINHFDDVKALATLHFCVADAKLLAEILVKRCGYPADGITLLCDGEPADRLPTGANIEAKIKAAVRKVEPGDTLLVYISCHGGVDSGQSHLCPSDFDSKNPAVSYIAVEHLRDWIQGSKATQKLLVLDACHSGASAATSSKAGGLGGDVSKTLLAGGLITFAAAASDQSAQENGAIGHGLFTYHLSDGLAGKADADHDGIVDSDEAYRYTLSHVQQNAEQLGVVQTPVRVIGGDVVGVFALSRVGGEAEMVSALDTKPGAVLRNSIGMKFSLVMPGGFRSGSPDNEPGRNDDEHLRTIAIGRPFFLGRYEVTQGEFRQMMNANPSWFCKDGGGKDAVGDLDTTRFPVEQVTWDEAVEFCRKLSALPAEKSTGRSYRLPTEAEWEYACRAGTQTIFSTGDRLSSNDANVNGDKPYLDSAPGPNLRRTTTVGSYKPNAWELYDMHGNAAEMCSDWYAEMRSSSMPSMDPRGPEEGTKHVVHGGSYAGDVNFCRAAARRAYEADYRSKSTGFRVVCNSSAR